MEFLDYRDEALECWRASEEVAEMRKKPGVGAVSLVVIPGNWLNCMLWDNSRYGLLSLILSLNHPYEFFALNQLQNHSG